MRTKTFLFIWLLGMLVKLSPLTSVLLGGPLKQAPLGVMVNWVGNALGQVVWTEWENLQTGAWGNEVPRLCPFPYRWWLHTGGVGWTIVFTLLVPVYFSTVSQFVCYTSWTWSYPGWDTLLGDSFLVNFLSTWGSGVRKLMFFIVNKSLGLRINAGLVRVIGLQEQTE